jgi:hypothetical protein
MSTTHDEYHWLTTSPSGRAHTHGADCGQTGWTQHAVFAPESALISALGYKSAICGTRPGTGWGVDLFIDRKCKRCLARLVKFRYLTPEEAKILAGDLS